MRQLPLQLKLNCSYYDGNLVGDPPDGGCWDLRHQQVQWGSTLLPRQPCGSVRAAPVLLLDVRLPSYMLPLALPWLPWSTAVTE